MRYRTIVADPPWPIAWRPPSPTRAGGKWKRVERGERPTRTVGLAYATMEMPAIKALHVADLADPDCVLFLWSTRRFFREGEAASVARAWGFEPFGEIIWGLRCPGLGTGAFRNDHEPVLVARRGGGALSSDDPLGVYFWKQVYGYDGRVPFPIHSAKPDGFLDLVEQVSPGPYLELFARRQRLGWDTYGDEALCHVDLGGAA